MNRIILPENLRRANQLMAGWKRQRGFFLNPFRFAVAGPTENQLITTYTFTETDGVHPASFVDMSAGFGQVQVIGNQYYSPYGFMADSRWGGSETFTEDQWASAEVTVGGTGANGNVIGVLIKASSSGGTRNCYRAYFTQASTNSLTLEKVINGAAPVNLGGVSTSHTWVDGDVIKIRSNGSTIQALVNNSVIISVTDTSVPSGGKPGIVAMSGGAASRGDNFKAGSVTA